MAMNAPTQQFPARAFMRPVRIDLGSQTFTLGGAPVTFALRQLGYLQQLLVHITGTYTVATAPLVFLGFGPYNIVSRFLLQTPNSPLPPINLAGNSMHVWNLRNSDFAPWRKGFRVPRPSIGGAVGAAYMLDGNAYHDSIVDALPVALGAQTTHLWWVLPFSLSVDDLRGILPLGNSTVTNLIITPATAASLVTTPANLTVPVLSVQVTQVYLTPPPAGAPIIGGGVDVSWTVAYDETSQALASVGLNRVQIVPNYTILGILHTIRANSVPAALSVIDTVNLRLNSSWIYEPPGLPPAVVAMIQRGQQGQALPQGVILYDQDVLGALDWIRTESITEIESDIDIATGTTLVAGDEIATSLRRLVLTQR